MRIATLVLVVVIVLLQWPLWVGKGSWLTVWHLQDQLEQQKKSNELLSARNQSLTAEVNNLKTGYDAVEERARSELGLIRQDEVFFQVLKPDAMAPYRRLSASPAAGLGVSGVATPGVATPGVATPSSPAAAPSSPSASAPSVAAP